MVPGTEGTSAWSPLSFASGSQCPLLGQGQKARAPPSHGSPTPDTCQSRGSGFVSPQARLEGSLALPTDPAHLGSPRVKQVLLAQAEAEKIRRIGEAEAAVIEAMGKAEAERMKLKAEAYQKYGDAAKMALVLEALPQVRLPPQAGTGWASAGLLWAWSATQRQAGWEG